MIKREFLEPITESDVFDLKPGEWIWDNRNITRMRHKLSFRLIDTVTEPIGFRQIDILDLNGFGTLENNRPFRLSCIDNDVGEWVCFSEGRFFKFKRVDVASEELIDKIAGFFETDPVNWSALKNCWLENERSDDLRALLKKALESEE